MALEALEADLRILHFGVLGTGSCIKRSRLLGENIHIHEQEGEEGGILLIVKLIVDFNGEMLCSR